MKARTTPIGDTPIGVPNECANPDCTHVKEVHTIESRLEVLAVRCSVCAAEGRGPCMSKDFTKPTEGKRR